MSESRRIDQVLPSFAIADAIGIDNRSIRDLLREKGFQSDIFCEEGQIDGESRPITECKIDKSENIIIHHFSIGSMLPYRLLGGRAFNVTRYHNITPEHFFPFEHCQHARSKCVLGRAQLPLLSDISDYYLSVSKYNELELSQNQFSSGTVLPLMRQNEQLLSLKPCAATARSITEDQRKTLLFVGRVVPNKAHHDLIFMLSEYKKHFSAEVRLVCVGGLDEYYGRHVLKGLCHHLELSVSYELEGKNPSDVLFTGPVSDQQLASFYRGADLFTCLSSHEGFCVPLVEAMNFRVPILAHKAGAVPETLGQAGRLVDKRDPVELLNTLAELLSSKAEIDRQKRLSEERSQDFQWNALCNRFDLVLAKVLEMADQA